MKFQRSVFQSDHKRTVVFQNIFLFWSYELHKVELKRKSTFFWLKNDFLSKNFSEHKKNLLKPLLEKLKHVLIQHLMNFQKKYFSHFGDIFIFITFFERFLKRAVCVLPLASRPSTSQPLLKPYYLHTNATQGLFNCFPLFLTPFDFIFIFTN